MQNIKFVFTIFNCTKVQNIKTFECISNKNGTLKVNHINQSYKRLIFTQILNIKANVAKNGKIEITFKLRF